MRDHNKILLEKGHRKGTKIRRYRRNKCNIKRTKNKKQAE